MRYRFGGFEFDDERFELSRGGAPIVVQPKPLRLLLCLLRRHPSTVTRAELLESVWPGTHVAEGSLAQVVHVLRRALDDEREGRLLRTVRGRGYRLDCDVATSGAPAAREASGAPFVGREDALAELEERLAAAAAGSGAVVVLLGEPGIGKTRLARELVARAETRGFEVSWGTCREAEGAPPLWPWTVVLRRLVRSRDDADLREALGDGAARIATLLPEVAERLRGLRSGPSVVTAHDRFALFDALALFATRASHARPLLIVIDDLHLADDASIKLLGHLAGELGASRVLVCATQRDVATPANPALESLPPEVRGMPVGGLAREEVRTLVGALTGEAPSDAALEPLMGRTAGNPLLLQHALRGLSGASGEPREAGLAMRLTAVIGGYLGTLSPATRDLLQHASILGASFSARSLAALAQLPLEGSLAGLDEATRGGVVTARPGEPEEFAFVHGLFRELLYDTIEPGRRARMHWRAGEQIEALRGSGPRTLDALAHHYYLGMRAGDPKKAYEASRAAARLALRTFAFEEAAQLLGHAVASLERAPDAEAEDVLETLFEHGEALRLAGRREERLAAMRRALDLARSLELPEQEARAAVGFCDLTEWRPGGDETGAILETALRGLGADDELRARLLARIAYVAHSAPDDVARAREALDAARRSGDPTALLEALYVLHFNSIGGDHLPERTALVRELVDLVGRQRGAPDLAVISLLDLASDRLMEGRAPDALRERDAAMRVAGPRPSPVLAWHRNAFDAGFALLEGRFDAARARIVENAALGKRVEHPFAEASTGGQLVCLERDRRGAASVVDLLLAAVGEGVTGRLSRGIAAGLVASFLAESGRTAEAARTLAAIGNPLEGDAGTRKHVLNEVTTACCALGDRALAARLREWLPLYADLHGVAAIPICYNGPVRRSLGRVCALLGERAEARRHLGEALEQCRTLGARPMEARTLLDLAGAHDDASRSRRRLAGEALELATALGMEPVAEAARALA